MIDKSGCLTWFLPRRDEPEYPEIVKPIVHKIVVSAAEIKADMDYFGLRWIREGGQMDEKYQHTDAEGWAEVLNYIYFIYEVDKKIWIPDFRDCDDFAFYMRCLCAFEFSLNMPVLLGWMSQGYHAWNCMQIPGNTPEERWNYLEPQNRNTAPWGEHYTAREVWN